MKQNAEFSLLDASIVLPSAVFSVPKQELYYVGPYDKKPEVGDVILGRVKTLGQHKTLENKSGRIHNLYNKSEIIGVFGNRYAPDYYEGFVPKRKLRVVDMLARSGLVGSVNVKNSEKADPTEIEVLGYVYNKERQRVNTLTYTLFKPSKKRKSTPRAKMILVGGTAMNSGKSTTAAAIIRALRMSGFKVRASKVTGTASLKDILLMNDAGAQHYSDFTFLGYPSTYMLNQVEVFGIFNTLDLKYANNPDNYWVVEFADGVNQREVEILLSSADVTNRIDKFVLSASDAFSALGALNYLSNKYNIIPDAISGRCTSAPLFKEEIKEYTTIPVIDNTAGNHKEILKQLRIKPSQKQHIV